MTRKDFPRSESGYFHLTQKGWVRQDRPPFPQDRCETWLYEMEWPEEDAKEQVTLTKVWVSDSSDSAANDKLRTQFGDAILPTPDRNVKLQCRV
jgi:hypothetical protein